MMRLSLRLLGDFEARLGAGPPLRLRTRKTQALLAYLASTPGQSHSRDKLAALLWGERSQAQARSRLRGSLFVLRRALAPADPPCLAIGNEAVAVTAGAVDVDAVAFARLVQAGEPEALAQAVAIYRGDLLQGLAFRGALFEDWLMAERERLRESALVAMAKLLAHQRRADHIDAALQTALRMLGLDPLQEPIHRTLMRLYAQVGRRAEALRQYQRCVSVLKRELRTRPEVETTAVYHDILRRRTVQGLRFQPDPGTGVLPHAPPDMPPHNLPRQLTSFVGRRKEIEDVKRLLSNTTQLLTLTGAGGCGKTRLALQVGGDALAEYADGVWLAELAPLADPPLVPHVVASTMGVREQSGRPLTQTLVDHLKHKRLLLILDNCEHVLIASGQLADALLRCCPHLKILATSRKGLGIGGELTYSVPPLSTPGAKAPLPVDSLTKYEAVQLFTERAVSSQPAFAVAPQNAQAVAQICRRLEGIPLAIELAAARIRALSPDQIAIRLAEGFDVLTGGSPIALPRYQTLRATMDWSYELLTHQERVLLRRLSVFAGGWTLEAAEAACADQMSESFDVLTLLVRLVEQSLVRYTAENGHARYRLLETVRQYANEKLAESGEAERVRERHCAFFLALAEEAEPKLWSAEAAFWLDRLEAEHDNVRSAFEWSLARSEAVETALRLAGALRRFWFMRNHLSEGRACLNAVLSRQAAAVLSGSGKRDRAKVLQGAGMLSWRQGDLAHAREPLEASVALFREAGDPRQACLSLTLLGVLAGYEGDLARARALEDESVQQLRDLGDRWSLAVALNYQGLVAATQGDDAAARSALDEGIAILRAVGDGWYIPVLLGNRSAVAYRQGDCAMACSLSHESLILAREAGNRTAAADAQCVLGLVAFDRGDYKAALGCFGEGLIIWREMREMRKIHWMFEAFARLATAQTQMERAARLFGAAGALQECEGPFPLPFEIADRWDRTVADGLGTAMGREAFSAAWARGRSMTVEQAMEYALQEHPSSRSAV